VTAVLEIRDLVAGYSGQPVLHHVNLAVEAGEVVSLLGANGAGKSTLLKTVIGTVPVIRGQIFLRGTAVETWPPHRRIGAGIGFSPEGRRVFANLSVEENLIIGATSLRSAQRRDHIGFVCDLFPVLHDRMAQRAGTLSGGEQQMLAVARAMMTRPELLMVEEPSQGLAPLVVDRIYDSLRTIASETRVAVLIAEQFQQVREESSDRILVIDKGEVVPDDLLAEPDLGGGA
jgi:ABC-type branched-subunit amino acid transport system ATPase component